MIQRSNKSQAFAEQRRRAGTRVVGVHAQQIPLSLEEQSIVMETKTHFLFSAKSSYSEIFVRKGHCHNTT